MWLLVVPILAGMCLYGGWLLTKQLGLLDRPGKDVPKRKSVPTLQGVVVICTVYLLCRVMLPEYAALTSENPFLGLWAGGALVAVVSVWDEIGLLYDKKFRIPPLVRLFVHACAALLAYSISGVGITNLVVPGIGDIPLATSSILVLTMGWYLLFINGINRLDGVYGLASGMTGIGFMTLVLLLWLVVFPTYPDMTLTKYALLGGVGDVAYIFACVAIGATMLERKPHGLLRDVGTMFFGFALAYLSLLGGAKIGSMIVVLALPLLDAIWVIIDRLHKRKKHPFAGDYSHLHHRLLGLGRSRSEIRVVLRGIACCLLVLMLLLGADRIGKIVVFLLLACIFFASNIYLYRVKNMPSEYDPLVSK